jgi:hypothetical protein
LLFSPWLLHHLWRYTLGCPSLPLFKKKGGVVVGVLLLKIKYKKWIYFITGFMKLGSSVPAFWVGMLCIVLSWAKA